MGKFFDLDSPLIRGLNKFADVMWLNILVLIFSIPLIVQQYLMLGAIVFDEQAAASQAVVISYVFWAWLVGIVASIPIGPALTAMHFVLLKIVREEESYITKTFFKSFKDIVDNMKQNYKNQPLNSITIRPFWEKDVEDTALVDLLDILKKLQLKKLML